MLQNGMLFQKFKNERGSPYVMESMAKSSLAQTVPPENVNAIMDHYDRLLAEFDRLYEENAGSNIDTAGYMRDRAEFSEFITNSMIQDGALSNSDNCFVQSKFDIKVPSLGKRFEIESATARSDVSKADFNRMCTIS